MPAVTPREAQRNRPEVAAPSEANRSSGNGDRPPSRARDERGGVEAEADGDEDDAPKASSVELPDCSLADATGAIVERRGARTRRERRGARRASPRATRALVANVIVASRPKTRATFLVLWRHKREIFGVFSGNWRQRGRGRRALVASPRKRRSVAPRPSQTWTARARAMSRRIWKKRGVGHHARALALALACAPTRARALQAPPHKTTPASRFAADPEVVETPAPAVVSLPVVLAPVPDLDRDDEAGVAARARLREAHAPRETHDVERRGAPGVSDVKQRSPDEKAKRDAAFVSGASKEDSTSTKLDAASTCHPSTHCAHPAHVQSTIGHGSHLLYPKEVRGVHAPACLRDGPPTCTCFGPFTYVRPWGYYCVLVPSKDVPTSSPPPIDTAPPSPPPIDKGAPPPPPPSSAAQCGDPPIGFTCDVSPDGLDPCGVNGLGSCVFVDGVLSCCCDAECDVFGDCCADKRSCCDEREAEIQFGKRRERPFAARIEASARGG